MSYEKQVWVAGDVITSSRLNHMEDGIEAASASSEPELSNDIKDALLDCFAHVAWDDTLGESRYAELRDALLHNETVESITAVLNLNGHTVSIGDNLNTLRPYLTVTANYSNGFELEISDYTLSGELNQETSTIQISFGGASTSITVPVVLWTFTAGTTVIKNQGFDQMVYRNTVAARACGAAPIINRGYVFTVTDTSKYSLAAYDVTSDTPVSSDDGIDGYAYPGGDKSISWQSSDSVDTSFVWLALKKNDGTDFTASELANGASEVFTWIEA